MTTSLRSVQAAYLDALILQQQPVSVYLKNNLRLKGFLITYNDEAVFLKAGGVQMIYKNAVSTICPETAFIDYTKKNAEKI